MSTMTFRVGACFDPDDSVARFIAGLAMMSNDWLRLFSQMAEVEDHHLDAEGIRLLSFRHQAALHFEAAEFIAIAQRRFPKVKKFVAGLNKDAREACDRIVGGVDPKSPHFLGAWLEELRNVTFHYAELHPEAAAHGAESIAEGLKKAANNIGTIEEDVRLTGIVRFGFADEVVVQWLPNLDEPVWIERLREAVSQLGVFVREASFSYLEAQDRECYSISG